MKEYKINELPDYIRIKLTSDFNMNQYVQITGTIIAQRIDAETITFFTTMFEDKEYISLGTFI